MSDNTINLMLKRSVEDIQFWLLAFIEDRGPDTMTGGSTIRDIASAAGMPHSGYSQAVGYISLKNILESLVLQKRLRRDYWGTQLEYHIREKKS